MRYFYQYWDSRAGKNVLEYIDDENQESALKRIKVILAGEGSRGPDWVFEAKMIRVPDVRISKEAS